MKPEIVIEASVGIAWEQVGKVYVDLDKAMHYAEGMANTEKEAGGMRSFRVVAKTVLKELP